MVHQAMADAGAAPETTFVVRDTSFDMAARHGGGCCADRCGMGLPMMPSRLLEAGAVAVADQPGDVLDLVRSLVHG